VRPWEIGRLNPAEAEVLVGLLGKLPPIGGTVLVEMRK